MKESKAVAEIISEIKRCIEEYYKENYLDFEPYEKSKLVTVTVPITKNVEREFEFEISAYDYDNNRNNLLEYFITNVCGVNRKLYFGNINYKLPTWDMELLPEERMEHILRGHTLKGRMESLIDDYADKIRNKLSLRSNAYDKLIKTFRAKINIGEALNKEEGKAAEILTGCDRYYHFPVNMTEKKILKLIKDAYIDAAKISKKQFPSKKDRYNVEWFDRYSSILYEGKAEEFIIHFWFCFDKMEIVTAYPVLEE